MDAVCPCGQCISLYQHENMLEIFGEDVSWVRNSGVVTLTKGLVTVKVDEREKGDEIGEWWEIMVESAEALDL